MKTKWIIVIVVGIAAWLYLSRRSAAAAAPAPSQPPPMPPGDTLLERTAAALPPGTPRDVTGVPYEPPLKA